MGNCFRPILPRDHLRPDRERRSGFTLVELLTVIAIIAVLATLLMTALSSAKRKARQAACTSNLRQISLALNMYLDDHEKRPPDLGALVTSKYLPAAAVLRCPEDKSGNWGGLIENPIPSASLVSAPSVPDPSGALVAGPTTPNDGTVISKIETVADTSVVNLTPAVPYSYLHPLPWENWAWDLLMKSSSDAGVAVCQLHGLGKPNWVAPSILDFEGLILRAQRDGAVVRRQVFWVPRTTPLVSFGAPPQPVSQWRLFTDETFP